MNPQASPRSQIDSLDPIVDLILEGSAIARAEAKARITDLLISAEAKGYKAGYIDGAITAHKVLKDEI